MSLLDKLKNNLKSAMLERRELEVSVLRMVIAAVHNRAIEKRTKGENGELADSEVMEVLGREVKKRKEAALMFKTGRREDLAERELSEVKIIETYLPAPLSETEIEAVVKKVIENGAKDFGLAMKEAMKELKGGADGKMVGEIIKKYLAS